MKKGVLCLLPLLLVVMCLCSCGKIVEVSDEESPFAVSNYEEISFVIEACSPNAVTYTVCSTKENFLFYEGHEFAFVQKYIDNSWHSLVKQEVVSTGDFKVVSIPTEETRETISISTLYGGKLEMGIYRLVAPCYASEEDLIAFENPVYIAVEFQIG